MMLIWMLLVVRQSEMKVAQKTERHRPSTAANPAPGACHIE